MERKNSNSQSRSGKNHYSRSKSKSQSNSKSKSKSRKRSSYSRSDSVQNKGNVLYVSNLSSRVKERHLEEKFGKYGDIDEVQLIKDPYTRGFAFIYYSSPRSSDEAIRKLHGAELEGRSLRVEKSKRNRPREQTPGRYVGRAGGKSKNFKGSRSRSRSPYYRSFRKNRDSRPPRRRYKSRSYSASKSRSRSRRKRKSRSRSRSRS